MTPFDTMNLREITEKDVKVTIGNFENTPTLFNCRYVPWNAVLSVSEVLKENSSEFGGKYSPTNWHNCPDFRILVDNAFQHLILLAQELGKTPDAHQTIVEGNQKEITHHLTHAACRLLMAIELYQMNLSKLPRN